MTEPEELERRLAELRAAFDGGFALAPSPPRAAEEELLAIQVGGDVYAVRLREIGGLEPGRAVTPVPSASPACLGLAAVRNELVAVFDLALLLGYASADKPRFLLLARGAASGFACAALIGHVRAPAALPAEEQDQKRLREVVPIGAALRPVIELSVLLREIESPIAPQATSERH